MKKTTEYYQSLDKRTKEYKEWKANFEANQEKESKGLGDTIEKFTEATGIKKVVKAVFGDDICGCDERKDKLNKLVPYKVVNCLTEEQYDYVTKVLDRSRNRIDKITLKKIIDIYNHVYGKKQQLTNCSSCVANILASLDKLIKNY